MAIVQSFPVLDVYRGQIPRSLVNRQLDYHQHIILFSSGVERRGNLAAAFCWVFCGSCITGEDIDLDNRAALCYHIDHMSTISSLANTLTPRQKEQLIEIADECAALGATSYQLAPLLAVLYLSEEKDYRPEPMENQPFLD